MAMKHIKLTIPIGTKNNGLIFVRSLGIGSYETVQSITIDSQIVSIKNETSSLLDRPRFEITFACGRYNQTSAYDGLTDVTVPLNSSDFSNISANSSKDFSINSTNFDCMYKSQTSGKYIFYSLMGYYGTGSILTENAISLQSELEFTVNILSTKQSNLTVEHGIGSGLYEEAALTQIIADTPAAGKVFSEWSGASGLEFFSGNAYTPSALFYMPSDDITLTATYIDRSSVISSGRYTGSAYQQVIPLRYDGTNWKECMVKRYDGTNWKDVDLT